jgi:hypothetical protein
MIRVEAVHRTFSDFFPKSPIDRGSAHNDLQLVAEINCICLIWKVQIMDRSHILEIFFLHNTEMESYQ